MLAAPVRLGGRTDIEQSTWWRLLDFEPMDLGIEGRVALVTGASKGLGFGIARALADEGARVAVSSRSRERVETAAASIGVAAFVHDSSDVDATGDLVDEVAAELGPVEILITNTGGPPAGSDALGFTREQWDAAYRDLVTAPIALIERVVPGMRERGWGRIVNVSSMSAREPIAVLMLSNTHRAAALAAFKTLAHQLAGDGITLNTLLTGRFATDRLIGLAGGSREAAEITAAREVPARRLGNVEEYAAAAAFLCSHAASYTTGAAPPVDGGLMGSVPTVSAPNARRWALMTRRGRVSQHLGHGHQPKPPPTELMDDVRERHDGVPTGTAGVVHEDDPAGSSPPHGGLDDGVDSRPPVVAGVRRPQNHEQSKTASDLESRWVVGAVGRAKEAHLRQAVPTPPLGGGQQLPALHRGAQPPELRMVLGVVADREAEGMLLTQDAPEPVGLLADGEERRRRVQAPQNPHDARRVRPRPIIEGQRHLAAIGTSSGDEGREAQGPLDRLLLSPQCLASDEPMKRLGGRRDGGLKTRPANLRPICS